MAATYRLGLDGGATKTEAIALDSRGEIAARHTAPGCNPSVVGADRAFALARETVNALLAALPAGATVASTLLCMAGSRTFWRETAARLTLENRFGAVRAEDDSLPVLELATGGKPGLVAHAGTGSFVAVRDDRGLSHYFGGLGWRFGDEGSGYDLGRRAFSRALLDLQTGQATPLAAALREHLDLGSADEITRALYQSAEINAAISRFAPRVLSLTEGGDIAATALVGESMEGLAALVHTAAERFFSREFLDEEEALPCGVSGPILNHPAVGPIWAWALTQKTELAFDLRAVTEAPIEGVRRLLQRG